MVVDKQPAFDSTSFHPGRCHGKDAVIVASPIGDQILILRSQGRTALTSTAYSLPDAGQAAVFGFLDILELPSLGYCGGLLIVSSIGRPLEFHCTAPVATNRTQQIMYGQTYRGFLLVDQIATALVDGAKQVPSMMIVQEPDLLPLGEALDQPVVLVEPVEGEKGFDGSGLPSFQLQGRSCWCVNARDRQLELVEHHLGSFASKLPLDEPFERIAQALEEAHAVLRAG